MTNCREPRLLPRTAALTRFSRGALTFLGLSAALVAASRSVEQGPAADTWPAWRGPLATGEAPSGDPPVTWSENENVAWRTAIPGAGTSTPVIWGGTIVLQTAGPVGAEKAPRQTSFAFPENADVYYGQSYVRATRDLEFSVVAVDRGSGRIAWQRVVARAQPSEGRHPTNTFASASPSTDGRRIIAFFGSRGLYALDMRGQPLWSKTFGEMTTRNGWGEGASPTLFRDRVVVPWDHEGESFIVALDAASGRELWRRLRQEPTTWSTPLVVPVGDRAQVIVNGREHVRAYDLETGEDVWYGPGLTFNSIPSPVHANGVAYLTSGFQGSVLLAIDLSRARGNVEDSGALLWRRDRDTPYVSSPLLYDGSLYVFKSLQGILTALDAASGRVRFGPVRLPEIPDLYASPVAAAGRIYVAGRDGRTVVLRHGPAPDVLAVNTLDDGFDASPAIVGDELYLRGRRALYRISRPPGR